MNNNDSRGWLLIQHSLEPFCRARNQFDLLIWGDALLNEEPRPSGRGINHILVILVFTYGMKPPSLIAKHSFTCYAVLQIDVCHELCTARW